MRALVLRKPGQADLETITDPGPTETNVCTWYEVPELPDDQTEAVPIGAAIADVDQQVLTPLDQASIMGTPPDETSIMCYQLPGEITRDGSPITGGIDINQTDYGFAARIYPKPGAPPQQADAYQRDVSDTDDWHESEDVDVASLALA